MKTQYYVNNHNAKFGDALELDAETRDEAVALALRFLEDQSRPAAINFVTVAETGGVTVIGMFRE